MLALSSWLSYGYLNFILFTVILKAFHEKAPACLRSQPQKLCFVSFITLLSTLLCFRSSVSISTLPLRPYSATFVGKASNEIIFTPSKIEEHLLPPSQRLTQQPGWETQLLDVTKAPNLFVSDCLCWWWSSPWWSPWCQCACAVCSVVMGGWGHLPIIPNYQEKAWYCQVSLFCWAPLDVILKFAEMFDLSFVSLASPYRHLSHLLWP